MKIIISLSLLAITLTACVKIQDLQTTCQQTHADFRGVMACLNSQVLQSRRLRNSPRVNLYLAHAAVLTDRVEKDEISEAEAYLELGKIHEQMRALQQQERRRKYADRRATTKQWNKTAIELMKLGQPRILSSSPRTTTYIGPSGRMITCTQTGNMVNCF